ncbi:cohesin domain-containing protein [Paenibacillus sanfengchensis]|uniref:cohesin domain-containing protein n=1 Tax=Paenibacillus sanfengchensis TaxID=3119819 RepID=UPI002FDFC6A5
MRELKNGLACITILAACFALAANPVQAEERTKSQIELFLQDQNAVLKRGSFVDISVKSQDVPGLFGIQFELVYDPDLLELRSKDSVEISEPFQAWVIKNDPEAGRIQVAATRKSLPADAAEDLPLAKFRFRTLTGGNAEVSLQEIKAVDAVPREIQLSSAEEPVVEISIKDPAANVGKDRREGGS